MKSPAASGGNHAIKLARHTPIIFPRQAMNHAVDFID